MHAYRTALLGALVIAGCATNDSDDAAKGETPDFRDGSYHYVLGYDPDSGEQIRGGAHAVVGFSADGKTEPIDSANETRRFHPDFVAGSVYHQYDAGLTSGHTDWDVFPSTWWPQSRNGIAWRWQPSAGQDYNDHGDTARLSPSEKYDALFYPGQTATVDAVSHCEYRDYVEDPDNCERIDHPALTVVGPTTRWELENQGTYQWVEPENWWGHCNGWASYATTEPLGYPRRDITVRLDNGEVTECTDDTAGCVQWRMADIEALMTELYFSDQATFSGRRCNTRPDEIERDEHGRPVDVACRDLNPGSFHVAIVGMLGRGARSLVTGEADGRPAFVIDHNYDSEVWNFPIVAYEIDAQQEVTETEATRLVGADGTDYVWNSSAASFVRVSMTYSMISDGVPASELFVRADQRDLDPVEVELHYVLELDGDGEILGGEWIDDPRVSWGEDSKELHPDFIWMATDPVGWGEDSDDLGGDNDNPYIAYSNARALLLCANEPASCAPAGGGGGTGGGNGTLVDVTGSVARDGIDRYDTGVLEAGTYTVTLSHDTAAPGGDADLYVRTGTAPTLTQWDCRPYRNGSDEQCNVTLSGSDTIHVMVHGYGSANAYALTIEGEGGDGGGGSWDGMQESGSVNRNAEERWSTPALAAGTYRFDLSGTGDADLYVRVGAAPSTSAYDCRPYLNGSTERCDVTVSGNEAVHVMVRGYAASSTFELHGSAL